MPAYGFDGEVCPPAPEGRRTVTITMDSDASNTDELTETIAETHRLLERFPERLKQFRQLFFSFAPCPLFSLHGKITPGTNRCLVRLEPTEPYREFMAALRTGQIDDQGIEHRLIDLHKALTENPINQPG